MIGGATPSGFDQMWTGTSGRAGGLQSRFVLAFSESKMPDLKTPNNERALAIAIGLLRDISPLVITLSGEAQEVIQAWAAQENKRPRVLDMAKRFALIQAVCNRASSIDGETMKSGLAFATYFSP